MKNFLKYLTALPTVLLCSYTATCSTDNSSASSTKKNDMSPVLNNSAQVLNVASTENKSAEDLVILAEQYYNGLGVPQDIVKALAYFAEAAAKGSGYACRRLGLEYSDFAFDDKTPKDDVKARMWFEKGAQYGDAESMFYLSGLVFDGRGGDKDKNRGTQLLIQAANEGSHKAAHRALKLNKNGVLTLSHENQKMFIALDYQLRRDFIAKLN
jgi:TPR repeat protein